MSDSSHSPHKNSDPISDAKAQTRQAANTVRDAASDAMRDMQFRGEAIAGELRDKADDLHKQLEVYVQAHPTKAVLIAAGAGFMLGLLIRR